MTTLKTAVIDGPYRYRLGRIWSDGPTKKVTFVMVNPSTADATIDDATIRKCVGFAERWGGGEIDVVNLFAWRAKDVSELARSPDPIGPLNDGHLRSILDEDRGPIVCAWGPVEKLPPKLRWRWADFVEVAERYARPLFVFEGLCKYGHPRHPLMTGYDRPLVEWNPREFRDLAIELEAREHLRREEERAAMREAG